MCMCGGCGGGEEVVGVGWEMGPSLFSSSRVVI